MILWGALLLPLLGAWVLHRWWPHRTVWWEYALPLGVCAVLIALMKLAVEHVQVSSTEYWGSAVVEARYYEDWNEYIHRTCTETCCCDSKGHCQTRTYDCSYVDYHPAYWQVRTTSGEEVLISKQKYHELRARFGNEQFTDLRRHYHTNDGDLFTTTWSRDSVRLEPVTTVHTYENRVKAADASIFHFQPVSDELADSLGLHRYPVVGAPYHQTALLGYAGPDGAVANQVLQWWNATLGPTKEVKLFVLVFKDRPREVGQLQEWYWKGGNMNEVVVCLGLDARNRVSWCHPISWGTDHALQAVIRQHVETTDTLDMVGFARWLGPVIEEHFSRRDFKEFDYLTVEPPVWGIVLTYVLTALATIGCCALAVRNEEYP